MRTRLSKDVRERERERSPTGVYSMQAPLKASHRVHLKDTGDRPRGQCGERRRYLPLCLTLGLNSLPF